MELVQPMSRGPTLGGDGTSGIVALVSWPEESTRLLADAWLDRGIPAVLLSPAEASSMLGPEDTALVRLDVLPTLDGIEEGLDDVEELVRRGVRVLNSPAAVVRGHDKLRTARCFVAARVPHPKTVHLPREGAPPGLRPPLVVKPRFGSWGEDVFRCDDDHDLDAVLRTVRDRRWFHRHGALLQQLVASNGRDIRLLVARSRVVGCIQRVAPPGQWRTNVSQGATRRPMTPTPEMCRLAIAAAAAVGADFLGVDLLPVAGGHVVIEVNGAVEFDSTYDLDGTDVYTELAKALAVPQTALVRV